MNGPRFNEWIVSPKVRVIDHEGENLGVMYTREAMDQAKELGLDLGGPGLGAGQQFAGRGFGKTQQDVGGLDLDALAGSRLDLQRGVGFAQDGGGFEGAVFFVQ